MEGVPIKILGGATQQMVPLSRTLLRILHPY